jgi:hypothetical protein
MLVSGFQTQAGQLRLMHCQALPPVRPCMTALRHWEKGNGRFETRSACLFSPSIRLTSTTDSDGQCHPATHDCPPPLGERITEHDSRQARRGQSGSAIVTKASLTVPGSGRREMHVYSLDLFDQYDCRLTRMASVFRLAQCQAPLPCLPLVQWERSSDSKFPSWSWRA